jgi:hypothetical protein
MHAEGPDTRRTVAKYVLYFTIRAKYNFYVDSGHGNIVWLSNQAHVTYRSYTNLKLLRYQIPYSEFSFPQTYQTVGN